MYADRLTEGNKRSLKERLNGEAEDEALNRVQNPNLKSNGRHKRCLLVWQTVRLPRDERLAKKLQSYYSKSKLSLSEHCIFSLSPSWFEKVRVKYNRVQIEHYQIMGQRQDDEKWRHDLYDNEKPFQSLNSKLGPRDLRLKLQKKDPQSAHPTPKVSQTAVRDLREKLQGRTRVQPSNNDVPKVKVLSEASKSMKKNPATTEVPESKSSNPPPAKKTKAKSETVGSFLKSLDLEKYSITFQAEEVDMATLIHMTDDDLKAMGIPMGPRKKILLGLESRLQG